MLFLEKHLARSSHPNLVFSSVGDRSGLHRWLRGRQDFDLWVTYYGDRAGRFKDIADYYNEHRGSKFQNLHYVYRHWGDLLSRYAAVLVIDDDVVISGSQISRLFAIRERFDLWALQPAFSFRGKISWPVTRARRRNTLRFTNFIEMTCPLFRKDKLDAFMAVYDPELLGWGCDWWFLEAMGSDLRGHVAVIDAIPCVNPHDFPATDREIDRIGSLHERIALWERIKTKYGIRSESRGIEEYEAVPKPGPAWLLGCVAEAAEGAWLWMRASRSWPVGVVRGLWRWIGKPGPYKVSCF